MKSHFKSLEFPENFYNDMVDYHIEYFKTFFPNIEEFIDFDCFNKNIDKIIDKTAYSSSDQETLRKRNKYILYARYKYKNSFTEIARNVDISAETISRTVLNLFRICHRISFSFKETELTANSFIGNLNIPIRSYNVLLYDYISTIGELIQYTRSDLLRINYITEKSLDEIEKCLNEHGFKLKEKIIDDQDVINLGLSTRPYTCLQRNGIETIDELVQYTISDLLEIRGIGNNCIHEIENSLGKRGLKLKEEIIRSSNLMDLGLSTRSYNCLMRARIQSIEKLIQYSKKELLSIINFGEYICNDIERCLKDHGLKLKEEENIVQSNLVDLDLSVRTYNFLLKLGIGSIEELVQYTKSDLLNIRGLGEKILYDIETCLNDHGLKLKK